MISAFVLAVCERDLKPGMSSEGWNNMLRIYGESAIAAQLDAGHRYRLALASGGPVGAAGLNAPGHLFLLYVHPDHRRAGIARRLVEDLLDGMPEDVVATVNSALGAIAFYRSVGYREAGPPQARDGIEFQPMRLAH